MPKKLNLTGERYGKLSVVSEAEPYIYPNGKKATKWNCICDCGNQLGVIAAHLRSGSTKSCGCINKNRLTKHGKRKDPIYNIWRLMKDRCLNPKSHNYNDYGGRGIKVCFRWMYFENFYKDMGDPPEGKTLDRIDNDGNYEPGNCKWSTPTEQVINRRIPSNNTSGVKGVYWNKKDKKWKAYITINKKKIHLGLFSNKGDAIAARKAAEEKYHKPVLEEV